jgi:hypothetical protein
LQTFFCSVKASRALKAVILKNEFRHERLFKSRLFLLASNTFSLLNSCLCEISLTPSISEVDLFISLLFHFFFRNNGCTYLDFLLEQRKWNFLHNITKKENAKHTNRFLKGEQLTQLNIILAWGECWGMVDLAAQSQFSFYPSPWPRDFEYYALVGIESHDQSQVLFICQVIYNMERYVIDFASLRGRLPRMTEMRLLSSL